MLWPAHVMCAATEWIFSDVCVRFPNLKIVLSEGGIGWVPVLLEKIERAFRMRSETMNWPIGARSPDEILHENFWFCAIEEPYSFNQYQVIGADRILLESDYPHPDTSWPDTQGAVHAQVASLPVGEQAKVTHLNASRLYQHPLQGADEWMIA